MRIAYVIAGAVLIADEETARQALRDVVGNRKRPFHWHQEGPQARMSAVRTAIETLRSADVIGETMYIDPGNA